MTSPSFHPMRTVVVMVVRQLPAATLRSCLPGPAPASTLVDVAG